MFAWKKRENSCVANLDSLTYFYLQNYGLSLLKPRPQNFYGKKLKDELHRYDGVAKGVLRKQGYLN
jgi:hypothetical protein